MAQRPPRILPTSPAPIPLDALLARAGALAQPHASRAVRQDRRPALSSHTPHSTHSDDTPQSVLLSITVSHCASCGASTRHVAPYVLVRYAENAHTVHYRTTAPNTLTPALLATLPHERRESHVDVPYCEECF